MCKQKRAKRIKFGAIWAQLVTSYQNQTKLILQTDRFCMSPRGVLCNQTKPVLVVRAQFRDFPLEAHRSCGMEFFVSGDLTGVSYVYIMLLRRLIW
jgi:hypothetical protein